MSDSPLYDLHTAYPFIWQTGEFPEALKSVQDMRIVVILPSTLKLPKAFSCTAVITALDASKARVVISMRNDDGVVFYNNHNNSLDIPVLSSPAFDGNSFVAVNGTSTVWNNENSTIQVHPDCIMLLQEAPKLRIRYASSYAPNPNDRTYVIVDLTDLCFANGYNVAVSGDALDTSTVVTLDCGSGNGLGIYRTSPWYGVELASFDIRGLRSLNGLTNDVHITDAPSVEVTSDLDPIASILTLTIKERE